MDSEFKEKLAELRSYIEGTDGIDQERQGKILAAVDDLAETASDEHHGLMQSLEESVLELEAAHPKATGLLQQISDALARMGI